MPSSSTYLGSAMTFAPVPNGYDECLRHAPAPLAALRIAEPTAEDNMLSSSDAADDRVKLHESLRAALDLIDQAFTLMDSELRLLIWNRAFVQMLDLPPELVQAGA